LTPTPALVVEPAVGDTLVLVPVLSALGFQVTATESFDEARRSLHSPPRLLITELRLGEFNGLHLVLRGLSARPDMAAIVTTTVDDPVLRNETEAMGATFIIKPTSSEEFQAAIVRTVLRDRQANVTPIRAPFERRRVERRALSPIELLMERRLGDRRSDARLRIGTAAAH
jgi:DNA-binding NtrC family response regulator